MAISRKRIIEIRLAQMHTALNEIMRDGDMSELMCVPESGEQQGGVSSDYRDRSFERTMRMSPFLWN